MTHNEARSLPSVFECVVTKFHDWWAIVTIRSHKRKKTSAVRGEWKTKRGNASLWVQCCDCAGAWNCGIARGLVQYCDRRAYASKWWRFCEVSGGLKDSLWPTTILRSRLQWRLSILPISAFDPVSLSLSIIISKHQQKVRCSVCSFALNRSNYLLKVFTE